MTPDPLAGLASVEESARLIRNYRYAVERMMRMLGGWIALTPEISAKLLLGRHVWDTAQHADALGKRLPELRAHAQVSEPSSAAFAAFMDALEEPEAPGQTVERLVGVYRVLKPHLLAVYQDHLARVNRVYEPPTERLLLRLAEDERRHIAAGLGVLAHLAATAPLEERGRARQRRLEAMLDGAGGVTGAGRPALADPGPPGAVTLSDDAREFIRLERSATRWPMAEDLARAIQALGDALVARDPAGVGRWLVPGAAWREDAAAPLTGLGLSAHRVVAFAKVGEHRLAKLRLDGSAGTATVLTRWIAAGAGWRAAALDVSGVELVRPA